MFFQQFSGRSSLFRTATNSLMEPPGPYIVKKNVTLTFGPGKKCREIMKAFDYNARINEGLKAAAETKRRERKPPVSGLSSRGVMGRKANKKVAGKSKGRGGGTLKRTTTKLNTNSDQVVEIANSDNLDVQMVSEESDSASSDNQKSRNRRRAGKGPKKTKKNEGQAEKKAIAPGRGSADIPLDEINDALSNTKL